MEVCQRDGEPKLWLVEGRYFPPLFQPENIRSAKTIQPRDSDIFICTYAKSGTTWLQHITMQLVHFDNCKYGEGNELCKNSPMIEFVGADFIKNLPNPRILKSHFVYEEMPKSRKTKYIFCARNPKDVIVSLYHHLLNFKQYEWKNGDFDVLFKMFVENRVHYGDYFEHLMGWLKNEEKLDVLFLTYEDMVEDLEREVIRIADFLGGTARENACDSERLSKIVENSRFAAMKEKDVWFPKAILNTSFLRQGGSRNWTKYFSKEQSDISAKRIERCKEKEISLRPFLISKLFSHRVMELCHEEREPIMLIVDGKYYPPALTAEQIRSAKTIVPRDSDIFICTYAKSGTTWLQHIVMQLVHYDSCNFEKGNELFHKSPTIEFVGAKFIENLPNPRILKSHFVHEEMPKSQKAKYIFCARNPKDVIVSFFHHFRMFKQYEWTNGDFDVFFKMFLENRVHYADYFDHLLGWLRNEEELDVLYLTYEDMLEDLEREVQRIALFLGGAALETSSDRQKLAKIVANSRFAAMKEKDVWVPKEILNSNFLRQGGSRNWTKYLTKEQSDLIDKLFQTTLGKTETAHWWREEMKWEDNR